MAPRLAVTPSHESSAVYRYFPGDAYPRLARVAAYVGAHAVEGLAVDIDPRGPR